MLNRLLHGGCGGGLMIPLVVEGVRAVADHAEVPANQLGRVLVQ